jgi:hypothetical protein
MRIFAKLREIEITGSNPVARSIFPRFPMSVFGRSLAGLWPVLAGGWCMALGRVFGTSMTPRILEHGEPHRIPPSEFGLRETGSDGGRKSPHWTLVGKPSSRTTRPGCMRPPTALPLRGLEGSLRAVSGHGAVAGRTKPGLPGDTRSDGTPYASRRAMVSSASAGPVVP